MYVFSISLLLSVCGVWSAELTITRNYTRTGSPLTLVCSWNSTERQNATHVTLIQGVDPVYSFKINTCVNTSGVSVKNGLTYQVLTIEHFIKAVLDWSCKLTSGKLNTTEVTFDGKWIVDERFNISMTSSSDVIYIGSNVTFNCSQPQDQPLSLSYWDINNDRYTLGESCLLYSVHGKSVDYKNETVCPNSSQSLTLMNVSDPGTISVKCSVGVDRSDTIKVVVLGLSEDLPRVSLKTVDDKDHNISGRRGNINNKKGKNNNYNDKYKNKSSSSINNTVPSIPTNMKTKVVHNNLNNNSDLVTVECSTPCEGDWYSFSFDGNTSSTDATYDECTNVCSQTVQVKPGMSTTCVAVNTRTGKTNTGIYNPYTEKVTEGAMSTLNEGMSTDIDQTVDDRTSTEATISMTTSAGQPRSGLVGTLCAVAVTAVIVIGACVACYWRRRSQRPREEVRKLRSHPSIVMEDNVIYESEEPRTNKGNRDSLVIQQNDLYEAGDNGGSEKNETRDYAEIEIDEDGNFSPKEEQKYGMKDSRNHEEIKTDEDGNNSVKKESKSEMKETRDSDKIKTDEGDEYFVLESAT